MEAGRRRDHRPAGNWWAGFGDPLLDRLEARIDSDNPTLAGAVARYDMAKATLAGARSGLFPVSN